VEYSLDGTTWSATPPASVFPASWQPIPGSSGTATLHVRATRPGHTVVGVYSGSAVASDPALLAGITLTDATGAATPLDALSSSCALVASQVVLAQNQSVAVPLAIALDPSLAQGRSATLRLDLLIDLSDTGVPTLPNGCPVDPEILAAFPGQGTGVLGRTGGEPPVLALAAGVALTLGGAVALAGGRRRARTAR
jgi:hypothetical protein